ncbi:AA2AR protein, partial [Amia calva]|nr:AA2AR protein [Amia calva]
MLYIGLEVGVGALAFVGNGLICCSILAAPTMQRVTNYLIASQAAADMMVGVLAVPFALIMHFSLPMSPHCCRFLGVFILLLTQTSIFSLLAIAGDRCLYVSAPLRYHSLMTSRRIKNSIVALWLFSFTIVLVPYLIWHYCDLRSEANAMLTLNVQGLLWRPSERTCPPGTLDSAVPCVFEAVMELRFMVYFNFLCCILPSLLLLLALYSHLFWVAHGHLCRMAKEQSGGGGGHCRSSLLGELRAARSLSLVVGVFAVCWLPLHVRNCVVVFCPGCGQPAPWLTYLSIVLSHSNSAINPFIYAFQTLQFRTTFRRTVGSIFVHH